MALTAQDFFAPASAHDSQAEAEFFASLKLRNGTFKRTRTARFTDLEEALGASICERADGIRDVLDIGASYGITTLEFADFLGARGVNASVTATDLCIKAHIVSVASGMLVLAEPDGWPLQYDIGGLAIRPWIRRLDYATLAFVPRILLRKIFQGRIRRMIERGQSRPVQLVSPRLAEKHIEMVEDDITVRAPSLVNRFDLVRAANILNLGYFSRDDLRRAVGNIRSYLRGPGARFLVMRTMAGDVNAGTLFELEHGGAFHIVGRASGGSEIEDLVLATTSPDSS